MTERAETLDLKAGRCRVCGCTERKPCAIESIGDDGDALVIACAWIDSARTLCSNPECVSAAVMTE